MSGVRAPAERSHEPDRQVVLLRAVNVGGTTLSMASFRAALLAAGCQHIRTVGAAGNAVVEWGRDSDPARLEPHLAEALRHTLGVKTTPFVRSAKEWGAIVERNPFPDAAVADPAHLVVTVLSSIPAPGAWGDLERAVVGRERVAPGGRHAYIVYPDGIGRSKLTAALIERKLGVQGTSRNWNTVIQLHDLTRG